MMANFKTLILTGSALLVFCGSAFALENGNSCAQSTRTENGGFSSAGVQATGEPGVNFGAGSTSCSDTAAVKESETEGESCPLAARLSGQAACGETFDATPTPVAFNAPF
jgi:hypothetical protein